MADNSQLEKMGRELKCPICLSLLNSAVSLTCNHVFCNLCIMKSMKSDSNCPVCKVPYQRREVRPAPHMDNLVSIYKSMEVASGFNIFVTQTAPPTKTSDGENQADGKGRKQRKIEGKGSKESVKANTKVTGLQVVKPSFPAKKRVQVPQYPLSETPIQSEKCEIAQSDQIPQNGPKNSSVLSKEKPVFDEKGEPVFSPFFWLREGEDEALEKTSAQKMEDGCGMDSPTPCVPSFSDIKDSDDEISIEMTPNGEVHSESRAANVFDSEMFEWTQGACSPELYSTPLKNQVTDTDEYADGIQEKECVKDSQNFNASTSREELITRSMKSINAQLGTQIMDMALPVLSSPKANDAKVQKGRKKSSKRNIKTKERAQRKRTKKIDGLEEVHTSPTETAGNLNLMQKSATDCKSSKRKKTSSDNRSADEILKDVLTVSVEAKSQNQGDGEVSTEFSVSSGKENNKDRNLNYVSKACKNNKEINTQYMESYPKRLKKPNINFGRGKMLEEISLNENQGNENLRTQSPVLSCTIANDGKASGMVERKSRRAKKIKTQSQGNCVKELRGQKRLKISTSDGAKNGLVDEDQNGSARDTVKEIQTIKKVTENLETRVIGNSESAQKILPVVKDMLLRKCESVSDQVMCAFCHSSEGSEASGEMVHYFNGRPVAANYNGGSSVIHSHKNCTEWAPNVYFEDDIVINLETEVARSRRIKCSCCGIKGAALGCYEKSCRKSFHVPCAKLVPQCHWDTDNFVILCPVHSSSKLPDEISGSQAQRRKRCSLKGQSHTQQAQVIVRHTSQPWKCSGSPNKWILCCSTLTLAEKETVSEFARLARASVSKSWDSSVTHVIASTDENGACRRTLKFLMGILEGKWILKFDWIKDCMKAMEPVDEENYEVNVDNHGIRNGPRLGRIRALNKQPKLFNGLKFYFTGEFVLSYKSYLQDLVVAAGGIVLQRKPISGDVGRQLSRSPTSTTFIVYNIELLDKCGSGNKSLILKRRLADAEALANLSGSKVAGHAWLLDSIVACKLQNLV